LVVNPAHVWVWVRLGLGGITAWEPGRMCVTRCLFSSNRFATLSALAEVCALLSGVLVVL